MVTSYLRASVAWRCSDEELVKQVQAGNARAAESLLRKYRPLVESRARSYFLRGADQEDVVQEGMIGLYKAIRDFRVETQTRFSTFADLCVTRQILAAVKKATRQKHVPLNAYLSLNATRDDSEATLLDCLPDPHSCDPAEYLFPRSSTLRRLEAARPTLSPLETCVLNGYLEGKTYRELSAELRCHVKSVDNALQRIKRKLAEPCPFD